MSVEKLSRRIGVFGCAGAILVGKREGRIVGSEMIGAKRLWLSFLPVATVPKAHIAVAIESQNQYRYYKFPIASLRRLPAL